MRNDQRELERPRLDGWDHSTHSLMPHCAIVAPVPSRTLLLGSLAGLPPLLPPTALAVPPFNPASPAAGPACAVDDSRRLPGVDEVEAESAAVERELRCRVLVRERERSFEGGATVVGGALRSAEQSV